MAANKSRGGPGGTPGLIRHPGPVVFVAVPGPAMRFRTNWYLNQPDIRRCPAMLADVQKRRLSWSELTLANTG